MVGAVVDAGKVALFGWEPVPKGSGGALMFPRAVLSLRGKSACAFAAGPIEISEMTEQTLTM